MTGAQEVGLKPCPFCGSVALFAENGRLQASVECLSCGAQGAIKRTLPEAIAAWNTRKESDHDQG